MHLEEIAVGARAQGRLDAYATLAHRLPETHRRVATALGGLDHAAAYVRARLGGDRLRAAQPDRLDDMLGEFEEAVRPVDA